MSSDIGAGHLAGKSRHPQAAEFQCLIVSLSLQSRLIRLMVCNAVFYSRAMSLNVSELDPGVDGEAGHTTRFDTLDADAT